MKGTKLSGQSEKPKGSPLKQRAGKGSVPGPHRWTIESLLHKKVVQILEQALPSDAVLHHSSNEGKRGWNAQRDLKASGAKKGWPDLEIIYRGRAIFIELKSATGRLEPHQREMCDRLILAGATVAPVCRTPEEVIAFLEQIVPLKMRIVA